MEHMKALALKFLASLALLYIILGLFYGMSFGNVFLITLVLGIASYIIGDLGILPRTSNTIATLADFGLSLVLIWMLTAMLTTAENPFMIALVASIGVALFEYFFHNYMAANNQSGGNRRGNNLQYQTEASEEFTPEVNKDNENRK